jgi:hypothetical protein
MNLLTTRGREETMVLPHIVEHAILVCQFRVYYMFKSWRREPGLFGNRFLEACSIRIMQPLLLPSTASEWLVCRVGVAKYW